MAAPGLQWTEDRYGILTNDLNCFTNVEVVAYMMEARMDVFKAMAYYFIFMVIVFGVVNCYLSEYRLSRIEAWRDRIEEGIQVKNV